MVVESKNQNYLRWRKRVRQWHSTSSRFHFGVHLQGWHHNLTWGKTLHGDGSQCIHRTISKRLTATQSVLVPWYSIYSDEHSRWLENRRDLDYIHFWTKTLVYTTGCRLGRMCWFWDLSCQRKAAWGGDTVFHARSSNQHWLSCHVRLPFLPPLTMRGHNFPMTSSNALLMGILSTHTLRSSLISSFEKYENQALSSCSLDTAIRCLCF